MGKFTFFSFLRSQLQKLPPVTTSDLTGKTVVVVGANIGIGFETAKHFARMNPARLVLACRNQTKGDAAAAEIAKDTGYKGAEVRIVDLDSFASVSAFATKFEAEVGQLDVLVCNAALAKLEYERSSDGWESIIQVNHLATSLLTLLLLPSLLKTAQAHGSVARLVIVSSDVHYMTKIPNDVLATPGILEKLSDEHYCKPFGVRADRYNVSKLLNVLFTRALNTHLAPTAPLILTTANPGFTHSALRRHATFPFSLIFRVMEFFFERTTEEGSRVIVFAALGEDSPGGGGADGMKGHFVQDCKVTEESDWIFTKEGAESERRIWDETIDILSKADPRVRQVVDEYLQKSSA